MPLKNNNPVRARLLTIKSIHDISPNLRRLCLTSPTLFDFPFTCGGAHIKIMLPKAGQNSIVLPVKTEKGPRWENPADKPLLRTFSVRGFRPEKLELDIDFALHGETGPASAFAVNAQVGDKLGISSPGGPTPMYRNTAAVYMAGDLTSLPAISAMLEVMPKTVKGYIGILVPQKEDIQDLMTPDNLTLQWIIGQPSEYQQLVNNVIKHIEADSDIIRDNDLDATVEHAGFWFGGDEHFVKALRQYVRRHLDVPREHVYAIPYWRFGETEEVYHQTRHDFMDN